MISIEVSAIVLNEGKVLIGRAGEHKWVTPGGSILEGETLLDATINSVFQCTGVTVEPKSVIFVSEIIEPEHRIILYLYADYVNGDAAPSGIWDEVKWVDVRELGSVQDEMANETIDAFFKFSVVLRKSGGAM